MNHANITYNPLQLETARHVQSDSNLVVLAPTSSGKTIVAEQYIAPVLLKGERAIYLSPLKALTNEKLLDWQHKVSSIVAITGDHMTKPRPITESLVLMTTEALDSKTRGHQSWLLKAGVIVSDESHLLSQPGRGDAFEVGLTRFAQINPHARIVFLSATIPNTAVLAEWLTNLNGKPTNIVQTDWRPVEQDYHLVKVPDYHWDFIEGVKNEIVNIRRAHKGKQFLIFVHTINMGNILSKSLKCPFHYSKIPMEERHRIEEGFRKKSIQTLVCTSTLAYGLNLPADVGIIVGAHRGPMMVDPADLKQEAGRVGRYGLSEKGYVYFLFCRKYADEVFQSLIEIPDIISVLPRRLYFHLCSFVAREGMQIPQIKSFLSKTLAFLQHPLHLDEAVDQLLQYEILKKSNGELFASNIGRASALMYLDPFDLYHWRDNFNKKPMSPTSVAQAFANIPSNMIETHVPKDLVDPLDLGYGQATLLATCLRDWLSGKPLEGLHAVMVPPIIKDIERIISGLKLSGLPKPYLENLALMIKNGVQGNVLDLVALPGIGRKRALSLSEMGIKTPLDIIKNDKVARNILGPKLFMQVKDHIENPGKIVLKF